MQRIGPSHVSARRYYAGARTSPASTSAGSRWIHPRFRQLAPPLIIVGMHRSGTSLVAGMLGSLGVYVGPEFATPSDGDLITAARAGRQSGYAEAAAFFRLNELLLRASRASWSRVDPLLQRRNQTAWSQCAELALRLQTGRSLLRDFLQPLPENYRGAWGWKDPRNSLTLPLWLKLFPEARIIHVVRDTEAVVRSLYQRARLWQEAAPAQEAPPPPNPLRNPLGAARITARKLGILAPLQPDPCLDPDYCRELCRVYREECAQAAEGSRALLEVRYEEILEHPEESAYRLACFAGSGLQAETIRRAGGLVLRER